MYQNPTYVISYFKNLANLNCKFHTTKTLLNSTIISSRPSNMEPSKKCKTSTTMKAVINEGHDGCTDVNVNGSIATSARIVDAAAIGSANATGNPMIKVDAANTTLDHQYPPCSKSWLIRFSISLLLNIPIRKCILLVVASVSKFSLLHWYVTPEIITNVVLQNLNDVKIH